MKQILLFLLLPFSSFLYAQRSIDSVALKQVDSLIVISEKLTDKAQFDQALEINSQAEKIALEKFGNISVSYANCCFNYGEIYKINGKYTEAANWFLKAAEIREKTLGKMNIDYAAAVNFLGNSYLNIDEFEKAELFILNAQEIYGKLLGKNSAEYIWTIHNLGNLYYFMGDYDKAESFYINAKDSTAMNLGKETRLYCFTIVNLANLYAELNNLEKAELLYIESKEITAKLYGTDHLDYVRILNNLSTVYSSMSKYEKAELILAEAKSIQEKNNRKEDLIYGDVLINFSNLYFNLGSFKKSELYLLEAKEIKKHLLGKDHPAYGDIIYNLSVLYKEIGEFEKAETFSQEAKEITANVLGRDHPDYAWNLNGLAIIYSEFGYYEKAEPMFFEAIELIAKTLGKESERYAVTLENLSIMYLAKAQYNEAALFILEAKEVIDKILGKENPEYTKVLKILATIYEYLGEFDKANNIQKEYLSLSQNKLNESVSFLSEQELAWYTKTMIDLESNQGSFLMSRINQPQKIGILPELMINYSLFHKGFLMNAACRINKLSAFSSESIELNNQLKSYRRRLASEFSKPIKDRNSVNELEEKANATEKELAHLISGFAEVKRQVNWIEVKQMLKQNQAAIEFINFRVTFPKATDSLMYAAIIIKPDLDQPEFIPLFEEKQLKEIHSQKSDHPSSEILAQMYSRGIKPISPLNSQEGLFDICWAPLDSFLKGVKTIYYSPTGLLHQINFDAIPMDKRIILSDRYNLIRLGSLRSIVIPDLYTLNENNDAVLYGGIQYELDTTHSIVDSSYNVVNASSQDLSFVYSDRSAPQRGGNWNYLPGTESEVNEIERIFKKSKYSTQVYRGNLATEETFKNLGKTQKSPRILHLATHGFFFPDIKDTLRKSNISGEQSTFKISDHPMIRSGLLLSGANYTWQFGKPFQTNMEDGILTAYEISQMNLSNTELVVLSACETGLGDVQGNEGVYGLQRAFKIAGAKYLIMSLWQVPDKQTSDLMKSFYQKWLGEKMSLPDAFRSAQKDMRERFVDPYAWAGFVLVE